MGEIIPATSKARWLKVQFRSNHRKNAGGFRCQIAAVAPITGSGSGAVTGTGSGAPGPVATAAPGSCQCGVKGGAANGRIVGGQETEEHEYPWQVGLVSRNGRSPWCGGTLISSTHVLTAAHCTQSDASSIRVILGEHNIADSDFNRVDVAEIINHPNYNPQTTDNDYAILRLANPVTFTNEVSPACLPADLSNIFAGVLPTVLQEVDVTVTTNTECNNAMAVSPQTWSAPLT